jgi:hypothetical protein
MRKGVIISVSITLAILVAGGGVFAWRHYHPAETSDAVASAGGSTPLNADTPASKSSSGIPLAVGDTNPSSTQQSNQAASNNNGLKVTNGDTAAGSGSGSGSSSNGSTDPDPITFSKYADAKQSQYQELLPGTGEAAVVGKKAEVLYRGWLTLRVNRTRLSSRRATTRLFQAGKRVLLA